MSIRSLRRIKKPCPGCGGENLYRESDKVCPECARLLAKVKDVEEAEKSPELVGVRYGERYHWNKYIHTRGDFESKNIMQAFLTLADSASRPSVNIISASDVDDDVYILGKPEGWGIRRLMDRKIAEAIRDLHSLIQPLIDSAYDRGKQDGHNLLMRLASGDLSPNEYLQKTEAES